jgi:hypothetical protein
MHRILSLNRTPLQTGTSTELEKGAITKMEQPHMFYVTVKVLAN